MGSRPYIRFFKPTDFDREFNKLSVYPIFANDIDTCTDEGRMNLRYQLITQYGGDALSSIPQCAEGCTVGGIHFQTTCPICHTEVTYITERPIESLVWIRAPEGMAGLYNPTIWGALVQAMTLNSVSCWDWLCDPNYRATGPLPEYLIRKQSTGYVRSYNQAIVQVETIYREFYESLPKKSIKRHQQELMEFFVQNTVPLLHKHLPVPSKTGFILEGTDELAYADKNMSFLIDGVESIVGIERTVVPLAQRHRDHRMVSGLNKLTQYYKLYANDSLHGKHGAFRRNVFGIAQHFTARAVITSIQGPHFYEEIIPPWSVIVEILSVHLRGSLTRMGYTPKQISEIMHHAELNYSPIINDLLQSYIDDCDPIGFRQIKGILVKFSRNPTLERLSKSLYVARRWKTDPKDKTFSMSPMDLRGHGADFDGDEMNAELVPDKRSALLYSRMRPHLGIMSYTVPRALNGNADLQTPSTATLAQYAHHGE